VEGKAAWGFINKNPLKEKGFASGCTDIEDGWKNMLAIRELIANTDLLWSNLPAFSWCKDLGSGLVSSGTKRTGVHMEFREK